MAHITTKLNLNKTPQSVDNNSLVFAKNIRLLSDGCLTGDCQIDETPIITINEALNEHIKGKLVGEVVGVNSKIYFFVYDSSTSTSSIYEYDETLEISEGNNPILLNTNWTYSGGEITGCVTINNTNESILTICEYNCPNNVLVPIKHINLSHPSVNDESLYTQSPEVPLANLSLIDYYTETIPNGVYQFFIRYKIAYEHYTNWFPCSRELYIASISETNTALGTLRHITPHTDSNKSFVLGIDFVNEEAKSNYTHFQLGFIISHDNASNARAWKEFPIEYQSNIYFSYKEKDIKEISIEEITDITYDLYNVGNITSYRNKLYASNYTETDFNRNTYVTGKIKLESESIDYNDTYEGVITPNIIEGENYAEDVTVDDNTLSINELYRNKQYVNKIINTTKTQSEVSYDQPTYQRAIDESINNGRYRVSIEYSINDIDIEIDNDDNTIILHPRSTSTGIEKYLYDNLSDVFALIIPLQGQLDDEKVGNLIEKYVSYYLTSYNDGNNYNMRLEAVDPANTKFKLYINNNWINVNKYEVKYSRTITYIAKLDYIIPSEGTKYYVDHCTTTIETNFESSVIEKLLDVDISVLNNRTLLPFTTYDFYIHYVTKSGSILNGVYIGSKTLSAYSRKTYNVCQIRQTGVCKLISILASENIDDYIRPIEENARLISTDTLQSNEIIYPIFDILHAISPDIKGWFISCYKHPNNIAQGFNINTDISGYYRINCLESDILLYNLNKGITLLNDNGEIITNKATYHSSGSDDTSVNALGNVGFIAFKNDNNVELTNIVWIKSNTIVDNQINTDKVLTKITPIYDISEVKSNKYELNLPGFISIIKKPNIDNGDEYFISSPDVFEKGDGNTLTEYTQRVDNVVSGGYIIHSNFNLNLLTLTTNIDPTQRNYKIEVNNQEVTKTQWFTPLNSLIASTIYNHESTYYDFAKRTYIPVDTEKPHNTITYDNTVRSSNIDSDESHRYIYKFYPNSYYNVPTNRGKIVKLFTILNNIYAHCEHGLFAFIDNKQLNTNNQSVALLDTDVFDIGVQEVLDSQYGYAGISNKEHALVTKDSYIFYDSIVKTIYLYDGTNKIVPISESIKKVIEFTNPTNVLFADDFYNNRFYINLKNTNGNVCLTYNFISKSFISIHDIDFDKAFNSRSTAYFVKKSVFDSNTQYNVYKFDNKSIYDNNQIEDIYYGNLYKKSLISVKDENIDNSIVPSTIDIICNNKYELINVLEYVNWISHLSREFHASGAIEMGEENRENYCGDYIRVYSDQTYTPLLSIGNNDEGVLNPNSVLNGGYKKPSFNAGIWTFNYLRNIKPEDIPDTRTSDKASLIYGKYFVVRFLFNNRFFKLENIIFNTRNYGKV